jgi:hypothetical protein
MTNHPNRSSQSATTLAQLVALYGANAYVFCDAGNGCAFGEAGQAIDYDASAAEKYGQIDMTETAPHKAADGTGCNFASAWIEGDNGYRYKIRF